MTRLHLIILAILAVAIAGCSSSKPLTEAEIIKHNTAAERLRAKEYLIKANRLVLEKRTYNSITPGTNFILVEGDKATVQVSPRTGGGPNGVGGFTVKGNISAYEVKEKANGAVYVRFNVMASSGSCSVHINLAKDGTNATANINGTFHGKTATIYGDVTEIDHSIFVGRPIY